MSALPSAQRTVLVVDDDQDIRESIAILVESEGHPVVTASHGAEAIDRLRSDPAPALVLLDLMMPVMDGWGVLRAMQANDAWAIIPVIVITANHEDAPDGVQAVLRKPFDIASLMRVLKTYCGETTPSGDGAGSQG